MKKSKQWKFAKRTGVAPIPTPQDMELAVKRAREWHEAMEKISPVEDFNNCGQQASLLQELEEAVRNIDILGNAPVKRILVKLNKLRGH